jgi:hypothetical protein
MSKTFVPTNKTGEFFDRLLKHILTEREQEFPVIVEALFSESPITERERKLFDNGYMMAVCHVFRQLSTHVAKFDFKSMPPETKETVPVVHGAASAAEPSTSKKVN